MEYLSWDWLGVSFRKTTSSLRGFPPEEVGWLLKVMQLLRKARLILSCWFHFLNCTWKVQSYHSKSSSHVYLGRLVSMGTCVRRVIRSGIGAWLIAWTRWEECVCHAYVFFMLVVYVLAVNARWCSILHLFFHVEDDSVVVRCVVMSACQLCICHAC